MHIFDDKNCTHKKGTSFLQYRENIIGRREREHPNVFLIYCIYLGIP
jgi:hypothetical protein